MRGGAGAGRGSLAGLVPILSPTLSQCPLCPRTLAGPHHPEVASFRITTQETLGRPFLSLNPQSLFTEGL